MQQDPPKIEFPCDYPVKVLGRSGEDLVEVIVEVFERHDPGFDRQGVSVHYRVRSDQKTRVCNRMPHRLWKL